MKNKWIYLLMVLGATMAFTRSFFKGYEQLLLIGGMALLMFGIYNISRKLSSKTSDPYPIPQEEKTIPYPHSKIESEVKTETQQQQEKK